MTTESLTYPAGATVWACRRCRFLHVIPWSLDPPGCVFCDAAAIEAAHGRPLLVDLISASANPWRFDR